MLTGSVTASAFVAPVRSSCVENNCSSLSAIDTAMAINPTYVIAGIGATVSAIGAAAIAFGRKGGESIATAQVRDIPAEPEIIDVSIPYDAAALLAYDEYTKSSSAEVNFKEFKNFYYEQMVAEVKATVQKRKVDEMKSVLAGMESDVAVIQDKIAALFGSSDDSNDTENTLQLHASIADADDVDLSIDYNGAAKLAYASSDKSMDFESFLDVYKADTVKMVAAKNPYR